MENLLITAICRSNNNIFNELARLAGINECRINYSHLYTLGTDNSITLQITGNWSSIAKIESALPALSKRLSVDILFKRQQEEKIDRYYLPYIIEIVAVDQPGIIYEITEFFNSLEVQVIYMKTFTKPHQQTPILKIKMNVEIPAENNIADIREQFLVFCDELNLDGTLEPRK